METWKAPEWSVTRSVEIIRRFPTYDVAIHTNLPCETVMQRIRSAVPRRLSFWKRLTADLSQFAGEVGQSSFTIYLISSLYGRTTPSAVYGTVSDSATDRATVHVSVRTQSPMVMAAATGIAFLALAGSEWSLHSTAVHYGAVVYASVICGAFLLHIAEGTSIARSLEHMILVRNEGAAGRL